jgi:hypothetical protein
VFKPLRNQPLSVMEWCGAIVLCWFVFVYHLLPRRGECTRCCGLYGADGARVRHGLFMFMCVHSQAVHANVNQVLSMFMLHAPARRGCFMFMYWFMLKYVPFLLRLLLVLSHAIHAHVRHGSFMFYLFVSLCFSPYQNGKYKRCCGPFDADVAVYFLLFHFGTLDDALLLSQAASLLVYELLDAAGKRPAQILHFQVSVDCCAALAQAVRRLTSREPSMLPCDACQCFV